MQLIFLYVVGVVISLRLMKQDLEVKRYLKVFSLSFIWPFALPIFIFAMLNKKFRIELIALLLLLLYSIYLLNK